MILETKLTPTFVKLVWPIRLLQLHAPLQMVVIMVCLPRVHKLQSIFQIVCYYKASESEYKLFIQLQETLLSSWQILGALGLS